MKISNIKIGVIGLGYIGLPLCLVFSKKYSVVGYDHNKKRIKSLQNNIDTNKDLQNKNLVNSKINYTYDLKKLIDCNVFIVAVPTPIYKNKKPNLSYLRSACLTLSKIVKKNSTIVFESTVYPGLTENFCIPLIEEKTKFYKNKDIFFGYSPERINPGDKKRTIENITKVVSGSDVKTGKFLNNLYKSVIKSGTYLAPTIKIAEAAKIIENCQRDINIAFINEIYLLFSKLDINPIEVLKASKTKWNFLNFEPGLVGGHCIGVDPYYLTYLAKKKKIKTNLILSGRSTNDDMAKKISKIFISKFKKEFSINKSSKILVMGFSFKQNCSDTRNTQTIKIYKHLKKYFLNVDVYDPLVNNIDVQNNFNIKLIEYPKYKKYNSILILVGHDYFKKLGKNEISKFLTKKGFVFDLKNFLFNNNYNS